MYCGTKTLLAKRTIVALNTHLVCGFIGLRVPGKSALGLGLLPKGGAILHIAEIQRDAMNTVWIASFPAVALIAPNTPGTYQKKKR